MDSRVRNLVASSRKSAPADLSTGSLDANTQKWLTELSAQYRGPETGRAELIGLQAERDPELLAAGLMSMAARRAADQPYLALEIYRGLAEAPHVFGASAARRAETRGQALLGRGTFGARFEVFASRFVEQASDPAVLAGMVVAGGVFQGLRLASLSRLLASPSAHIFTRGIGARGVSTALAFAAEAPAFSAALRGANTLLGRPQDWSREALRQELASGYLMLGALRLSGAAGNAALGRLGGASLPPSSLTGRIFQQGGMLTGILSAHWLEGRIGLREGLGGADLLAESLATLLQFNVAGRLLRELPGHRWNRELQLRNTALENGPPSHPRPWPEFQPAWAQAGTVLSMGSERPKPLLMSSSVKIGPRNLPELPLSENSAPSSPWPAPVKRNPALYLRYRASMTMIGHHIYTMMSEMKTGNMLWLETSLHVTRFLQDNFVADLPRMPLGHQPYQRRLIANLGEIRASLETMRTSMLDPPFDATAVDLVSRLYRIPNRMVNYLNSGDLRDLQGSLSNAGSAVQLLRSTLLPPHIVNRDGENFSSEQSRLRRIVKSDPQPWDATYRPFYDFLDSKTMHVEIPPESISRILLLGNIPAERSSLAGPHQVEYAESPRPSVLRLVASAMRKGTDGNIRASNGIPSRESFDYVEAYDALSGADLLTAEGQNWLQTRFFQSIRPGGIGLWMTRDTRSLELAVDLALSREWADVILGSQRGESPLRLPSRPDYKTVSFVFFRKLPGN